MIQILMCLLWFNPNLQCKNSPNIPENCKTFNIFTGRNGEKDICAKLF